MEIARDQLFSKVIGMSHVPLAVDPWDKRFAKMAVNYLEIHFEMSGCFLQLQIDKWPGIFFVTTQRNH